MYVLQKNGVQVVYKVSKMCGSIVPVIIIFLYGKDAQKGSQIHENKRREEESEMNKFFDKTRRLLK